MCEILNQLKASSAIIEWIDPWDTRLERATGRPAPQKGGVDRMEFEVHEYEWPELASAISRLIIPESVIPQTPATVIGTEDWNRVVLELPTTETWAECFPANDQTNILTVDGLKRWAAVGITDNQVGISVFAAETPEHSVVAKIQSIPDETVSLITMED